MTDSITVQRPSAPWVIIQAERKLRVRYSLPGASGWDRAGLSLQRLLANGAMDPIEALQLALPTSWMVNNRTTSPVFQKWMQPRLRRHWKGAIELLMGLDHAAWLALGEGPRSELAEHVAALAIEGQGAAAVSKVLAQLAPVVPLMDDAAIHFALAAVDGPDRADRPSAGPEHILPMLDWVCEAVASNLPALTTLAASIEPEHLAPVAVFDRILWFESWGYRLFGRKRGSWWWLTDGTRQCIAELHNEPHAKAQPELAFGVKAIGDERLRRSALAALSEVGPD